MLLKYSSLVIGGSPIILFNPPDKCAFVIWDFSKSLNIGKVSSIIVAFGPKIADFINGTNEATKAEDKFAQSLSDARAEASETGIRLQAYLTITQNASVSDARRAEALKAVQNELGKVNSAYAATITNVAEGAPANVVPAIHPVIWSSK